MSHARAEATPGQQLDALLHWADRVPVLRSVSAALRRVAQDHAAGVSRWVPWPHFWPALCALTLAAACAIAYPLAIKPRTYDGAYLLAVAAAAVAWVALSGEAVRRLLLTEHLPKGALAAFAATLFVWPTAAALVLARNLEFESGDGRLVAALRVGFGAARALSVRASAGPGPKLAVMGEWGRPAQAAAAELLRAPATPEPPPRHQPADVAASAASQPAP